MLLTTFVESYIIYTKDVIFVYSRTQNRIKILRKSEGLSQKDFGRIFSVDQTAVSNWENGKNSIDLSVADKIANHFKVPVEFVYGKPYTVTRCRDEWSQGEKHTYDTAKNEERRTYLEFVYGRGVFEGSRATVDTAFPSHPTEDEIKIALFGGDGDVTDEMWEEVKRFVEFVKSKKDR